MHRPILTRAPRNQTVLIGSNVSMVCEVLSDAHRHLEWYHGYHTSFDTVNKTNQSLRVEVKVGFFLFFLLLRLLFVFFPLSSAHFRSLSLDYELDYVAPTNTGRLLTVFQHPGGGTVHPMHALTYICVYILFSNSVTMRDVEPGNT